MAGNEISKYKPSIMKANVENKKVTSKWKYKWENIAEVSVCNNNQ